MACFNVLAFVLMLLPFEGKEGSVARDSAAVAAVAAGQQQVLSDSIPQSFMDKIDYYYKAWFHSRTEGEVQADSAMLAESGKHPVTCSDSLYLARLDSLQSGVPLSFCLAFLTSASCLNLTALSTIFASFDLRFALMYLIVITLLSRFAKVMERRLNRGRD